MYVYGIGLLVIVAVAYGGVLPHKEPVAIISQVSEVNPDGSFSHSFDTENGISVKEQAVVVKSASRTNERNSTSTSVTGTASWISPEGIPVVISWMADENGAHFTGSHLPIAPPAPKIPPAIQRSLEWIAAHPYVEPMKKH